MKKTDIIRVTAVAERLGWTITVDKEDFCFQRYSPAGQDFFQELTAKNLEELAEELNDRYEGFDCSTETYIWLDESGHGRNGAPSDMRDLYNDMEACEKMLKELSEEIQKLIK